MKNIKKLIIIVIIILIVIIVALLLIKKIFIKRNNDESCCQDEAYYLPYEELENDVTIYYQLKNCINLYLSTINKSNLKIVNETEVYNLLSDTYIATNNINVNNITSYIDNIQQDSYFYVINEKKYNDNQYGVYGIIQNKNSIKKAYYIINFNDSDKCFSIEPLLNENIDISNLNVKNTTVIKNESNIIPSVNSTDNDICKEFLIKYNMLMLIDPDEAYTYLNDDYKNAKFTTVEDFKKYINENKYEITNSTLDKGSETINADGTTTCVCTDKNSNYYCFYAESLIKYSVFLDSYTVNTPDFTEKYNSASSTDKVSINIDKIKNAVNKKDYKYIYNKLDSSFKGQYFPSEDKFEQHIKNNVFDKNEFSYKGVKEQDEGYYVTVNITDSNESNTSAKIMQLFMKLDDNNDFVIAFNFQ